jgi:hypothetical protein
MKGTSIILSITILLLTLSSCDIFTTDIKTDNVIMPLEVGNYWEYSIYEYNGSELNKIDSVWTISIISDTIINNQKWYVDHSKSILFTNKNNGLWGKHPFYPADLFLKYPGKVSDEWLRQIGPVRHYEVVHIISTDYPVVINSITKSCYEYEIKYLGDIRRKYYAAPGLGITNIQIFKSSDSETSILERELRLENYKIK